MAIGARWEYRLGALKFATTVAAHETFGETLCARIDALQNDRATGHEHLCARIDGLYRHASNGRAIDPPVCILKFEPGASWVVDSKMGAQAVRGSFACREEEVEVPAGRFRTLRSMSLDSQVGGQRFEMSYWFAPGVGLVKRSVKVGAAEAVQELVSYSIPK
jgi:hypothetical protein